MDAVLNSCSGLFADGSESSSNKRQSAGGSDEAQYGDYAQQEETSCPGTNIIIHLFR